MGFYMLFCKGNIRKRVLLRSIVTKAPFSISSAAATIAFITSLAVTAGLVSPVRICMTLGLSLWVIASMSLKVNHV